MNHSPIPRFMLALSLLLIAALPSSAGMPSVVIKNNHDMPYTGPVSFRADLPDDFFEGRNGSVDVTSKTVLGFVRLAPHSEAVLLPVHALKSRGNLLDVKPDAGGFNLSIKDLIANLSLGLVIIPGRTGTMADAVSAFKPLDIKFDITRGYPLQGKCRVGDYEVEVSAMPYGEGFLDINASVTRVNGEKDDAYIALVRRVSMPGMSNYKMRWNGQMIDNDVEPANYNNLGHCVDWFSWKSKSLSFMITNGFTPGLTTEREPGRWIIANHYYVWERVLRQNNDLYFISEIAGPDPNQKPGYKGVSAYMTPLKGEPVKLRWRLAVTQSPQPKWEESQFLVYAGYRKVTKQGDRVTVDLGVPYVEFGTSYFPYSTMCENFDFYRNTGLDREGWWPFSPKMWENWEAYIPQMQTDLRIIRAMGFEWVRMHHLELLGEMDRVDAMMFIDFYMNECRKLGLKVLIDTAGSTEWISTLAGRYKDVVKRLEIENEVLIPGIKPGDAERWAACYKAAKQAAPNTDVFLTGCGNLATFDRIERLGVPFDRLGYHTYKHKAGGEEALNSAAVAVAGCAADRGKTPILSEFNWKFLTRYSPEARAKEMAFIYANLLEPRAVPELLQFHWQETMSVNPLLCRQGIRHYETIYLDRRPKPEAFELMKLIRQYCGADAPIRELPITITQTTFANGKAKAEFTLTNNTAKAISAKLTAECFGDAKCRLASPVLVSVKPGKFIRGSITIAFKSNAMSGVYHFFVKAMYAGKSSYGWSYASNFADPIFDPNPVLPDLVEYPRGTDLAGSVNWSRPTCVAFGADAPVVELEMAYEVFNTLQSATGRSMRLCSTADIPASMMKTVNLILVGTPESNPLIKQVSPRLTQGRGSVQLMPVQTDGMSRTWLLLTGDSSKSVEAAATDFVLRYWRNAKDSTIRITGMENGAALGNRAKLGQTNPP